MLNHRMKWILITLCLSTLCALAALSAVELPAATADGGQIAAPPDYFPLPMQHTWRYRWWNDRYEPGESIDSVTVIGKSGDNIATRVVSTHSWSHSGRFDFRTSADSVIYAGGSTSGGSHFPVPLYYAFHFLEAGTGVLIRYPVQIGGSWTSTSMRDGRVLTGTTTVVGFERVRVPAGEFLALRTTTTVEAPGVPILSGTKHMWFADGVGLVKLVYEHGDGSRTTVCLDPEAPAWPHAASNPVLGPQSGSWDEMGVMRPSILRDPRNGRYRLWYTGIARYGSLRIGYAESADGTAWERPLASPVLDAGPAGSWDEAGVAMAAVFQGAGGYLMWFTGVSATDDMAIGFATSTDGLAWTRHAANPVLRPGPADSWDDGGVRDPAVVYRDGLYHLWYTGLASNGTWGGIGYASSPDGIAWTKHVDNPVFRPDSPGAWDAGRVFSPWVLYDAPHARYEMWYAAYEGLGHNTNKIGRAFSSDGIIWTRDPDSPLLFTEPDRLNPFLPFGQANNWEAYEIDTPAVLLENGLRKVWYSGAGWVSGQGAEPKRRIGLTQEPRRVWLPAALR